MYNAYSVVYVYIHVHVQSCTVQCIQYMYIVYIFVGCCLATRGVRGLLWAKGWVWLTESWPERLLGNSQQNCYITLRWRDTVRPLYALDARCAHAEVSRYRDCPSPVTSSQK